MLTKLDIEKYFLAEKQASLFFITIGLIAIMLALLGLFVWKTNFWKGATWPLLIIAVIQIAVGITIYKRSDGDRVRIVYAVGMNPDLLKEKELPRMQKVYKNFVLLHYIEFGLLLLSIVFIVLYKNNAAKQAWYGFAIALAIQAVLMLGADYLAAKRAQVYMQKLVSFVTSKS